MKKLLNICFYAGWTAAAMMLLVPTGYAAQEPIPAAVSRSDHDEAALLEILYNVGAGQLPVALEKTTRLIQRNPTFRLARLVYADLLLAQDRPMASFGGALAKDKETVNGLLEEARRRLEHQLREPLLAEGLMPSYLMQTSASQRHAVVVDASLSRLHLFANTGGQLRLVGNFYVSVGKKGMLKAKEGDQRSPIGVYFVTTRLDPSQLSDFYGTAALPINYPNEWDLRLGRSGYGIWLHGVPQTTYNRAPFASDGCLALTNQDMAFLSDTVDVGTTPVIIADRVDWVPSTSIVRSRETFLARLERWRQDWESREAKRYSRHYSKSFASGNMDYARWVQHKTRVARQKTFIKVKLGDISIFQYPGEPDLVVVSFTQDYRSSNFNVHSRKRQYWRKESDGVWRIVYENKANFLPIHFRGIPYSARSTASR